MLYIDTIFFKEIASPSQGKKMSKRLGGIIDCKYKASSWHSNGFPDGSYAVGNWQREYIYTLQRVHRDILPRVQRNCCFID